jgi:hypothetical protein
MLVTLLPHPVLSPSSYLHHLRMWRSHRRAARGTLLRRTRHPDHSRMLTLGGLRIAGMLLRWCLRRLIARGIAGGLLLRRPSTAMHGMHLAVHTVLIIVGGIRIAVVRWLTGRRTARVTARWWCVRRRSLKKSKELIIFYVENRYKILIKQNFEL